MYVIVHMCFRKLSRGLGSCVMCNDLQIFTYEIIGNSLLINFLSRTSNFEEWISDLKLRCIFCNVSFVVLSVCS